MLLKVYYCSFSAVTACSFDWLSDGKFLIKIKLNHFINSVSFLVRSIQKKGRHGNYSVKGHSEKYSTWYTLRKKCLYLELYWSVFSHIGTEYGEVRSISLYSIQMWKMLTRINPTRDTFYAVTWKYTVKSTVHSTVLKLPYVMVLIQIHTSLHFEHFI